MPLAAPSPDRERPALRPGRHRQRPVTAPLKPGAVAGLALLLALATLHEPAPAPPTEAAWADSAQYPNTARQAGGDELAATADSLVDVAEGPALLLPVAISEDAAFDDPGKDDSAVLGESRAEVIALRLASRLAWQVTGSFSFAPFVGVWTEPWALEPARESGIAIEQ